MNYQIQACEGTMSRLSADYEQLSEDYYRVEKAIQYLEANYRHQPSLEDVANHLHVSECHFQRIFKRWAGISPKRFLQYITKEYAKNLMEEGRDLLEVAYGAGLSGSGRLHDLFVTCEAVTPGEYKRAGEGVTIHFGVHPSPFGECTLAVTERGICGIAFGAHGDWKNSLGELKIRWKAAEFKEDAPRTQEILSKIFALSPGQEISTLPLYLRGTNFQIKVWEALLRIPSGYVVSYEDVAIQIGMPGSARAVSGAVARNPIPVIIPCHRVIRKMGAFGGYRWGAARKKALLGKEFAALNG